MTIKSGDDVRGVGRLMEEYVTTLYGFAGAGSNYFGWMKLTIDDIDTIPEENEICVRFEEPWGDYGELKYNLDTAPTNNFSALCEAYGVPISKYEDLEGNIVWVKAREIKVEDGVPDILWTINYDTAKWGPYKKLKYPLLIVAFFLLWILPIIM